VEKTDEHAQRHPLPADRSYRWIWNTSDEDTKMVSCLTCGYRMPYNADIHTDVEDID